MKDAQFHVQEHQVSYRRIGLVTHRLYTMFVSQEQMRWVQNRVRVILSPFLGQYGVFSFALSKTY